ncbi:MAG: hypothetical protein JRF65_16015, partial [Deltaproteobacteria bacterium]|nr:hypothetical protein [Deltaproteobacteria bacterium]
MTRSKALPVLVGVGQLTNRSKDPQSADAPIHYMVHCAGRAAEDAGVPDILSHVDTMAVIEVMSKDYAYDPKQVAEILGVTPGEFMHTTRGATLPQVLTTRLCDRIAEGRSEIGLICAAEAFHSSAKPDWEKLTAPDYENSPYPLFGDRRDHATNLEKRYGLYFPSIVYPLIANAFRKSQNLTLEQYIWETALLYEKLSKVARKNAYAWFREGKTASEIATITETNRMVSYPFTKFMNAIMNVDQAAALLITSEQKADALGIPQDKRVYLIGSSEVYDKWYISDRVNYYSAPALELAFKRAFLQAGVSKDDIDFWDLYSCFPVALQIAVKTLALPSSVTPTIIGGLPYFGGPGNHYSLHAICEMVRRLRESPEKNGVVQSLSWYMNKFAVGIYSGRRPTEVRSSPPASEKHDIEKQFPDRTILEKAEGAFFVETYVVSFDREGIPASGVVIAEDEEDRRVFAVNETNTSLL